MSSKLCWPEARVFLRRKKNYTVNQDSASLEELKRSACVCVAISMVPPILQIDVFISYILRPRPHYAG